MNPRSWINIEAAFEFLLEELEIELAQTEGAGDREPEAPEPDPAGDLADLAAIVADFRNEVRALRRRWDERAGWLDVIEGHLGILADWRPLYRLNRAPRTPVTEYYDPVLSAIYAVGGAAKTADLVHAIPELMQGVLTPTDREPLTSAVNVPRWRNALGWARRDMLDEGWLAANAPPGVWRATPTGLWRRECMVPLSGAPRVAPGGGIAPAVRKGGR